MGGCGPGDPRISQGLPGAFSSLTLAPHGPSDSRGLLSSCQDACSLMGIFRRGPWACVLEPSQAAAQRAGITEPCQGFETSPQHPPPPGLALPPHGRASGWAPITPPGSSQQSGPASCVHSSPSASSSLQPSGVFQTANPPPSPLLKTLHGSLVPRHKAQAPNPA